MSEAKVGFLFKAAAIVSNGQDNHVLNNILKSYYLLKSSKTTKGYGLPQKQFSTKSRCSHCFLKWNNNFDCKVVPLKISKRQRKRIKHQNKMMGNNREEIINGNKLEQICNFCKQTTVTYLPKPNKEVKKCNENVKSVTAKIVENKEAKLTKTHKSLKNVSDVYCNSKEVFSLKNNKNTLQDNKSPKIIKTNKKKKDKFAGLCQKAVLSAAKLKDNSAKPKTDKDLIIFLKPAQ
ncbi:uncharacterized protein LOC121737724 [Aricia agestis]|uniref:uncharacterized protein LOC121737724 n=1 Tax=Aricia agestis TaxID=91739 RepID=UPI001C203295|nr:uncharacterized protein LOC121737724 [Aricia agestis]